MQEYVETVHGWNQTTLLRGISQFLRDTALEWYCQLRIYHRQPETWAEFIDLFLSQFNSPIRNARQEQEWHECKQRENETINEFLVRLRAIWTEQKPTETEVDLVRHLLCKMRSDLLNMIGISRGASLDEIVMEAQKAEEILYHRNKQKPRFESVKQVSFQADTQGIIKRNDDGYMQLPEQLETMGTSYNTNSRTPFSQRIKNGVINRQNTGKQRQNLNYNTQRTTDQRAMQTMNPIKCYNCGLFGHLARNCLAHQPDNNQKVSVI